MSKYITLSQLLKTVKIHLITTATIFLLAMFIFAGMITTKIGGIIFSCIATLVYFLSIYTFSLETANRDKKSYTKETPYKFKGLLLPLGIFVITIFLYALYSLTWKYMTFDNSLYSFQGYFNNIVFIIWTFPFNAFLDLNNGILSWYGYLIIAIVPFIASFLGYYAGYIGYDISMTINKFIYDSNEKENHK